MNKNKNFQQGKINKKTASSIALILLLAMSLIMPFIQSSNAQVGVPQPVKTTGYIDIAPRVIGVDQEATVNIFVYPIPTNFAYRPYYDGYRGVTVTFTRPDGTKDTFMPVDGTGMFDPGQMQSLGAIYFFYKPNMAGNWSVSFTMPDQNLTDATGTVLMTGCTSNTVSFTVQTDPVLAGLLNGYPWSPLPNDNVFWSYPISSNNREWSQISGDWLGSASSRGPVYGTGFKLWQPYGSGPETGHIVWKLPYRAGGLIGGDYGSLSYGAQGSNIGSAIMQGKLIVGIPNTNLFECVDLATGEVLYTMEGSIASGGFGTTTFGYHLPGSAHTQSYLDPSVLLESSYGHEYTPYLIQYGAGTYNFYDHFTGVLKRSIANASSVQFIDGSEIAYGTASDKVFRWNMSKTVNNNFPTGIEWETPLPTPLTGLSASFFGATADAVVVKGSPGEYWGYSAETGVSLWNITLNYPTTQNQQFQLQSLPYFIVIDAIESTFKCYSMLTGAFLWESDSFSDSTWATTWTVYWSAANDNENLYFIFPDGTIRTYSLADGHEVWRSEPFPSTEYPNNALPLVNNVVLVDGKLYAFAGYTSQYKINPISRFAMLVCINATNGDTVFTLNGGIRVSSAANGYVVGTGDFDGNLYCLGKGKTETTVTAPLTTVSAGTSVLIQGSVMDLSPASENTPAVSDDDMSEWMDYLHMQNATLLNDPPKPDGVTVRLAAIDPNGNVVDLGTVTSDSAGMYKKMWTPELEGEYTVYATFDGSNSYYGSYAQTALGVTEAPAATTTAQTQTQTDNSALLYGILVAVIIAIIIGLLALFKKR